MPRPAGFLDIVREKFGDTSKTLQLHLEGDGNFFDGGDLTVSIQKLSVSQAADLGLDPHTQKMRLYCEGKFFRGCQEIHFQLDDFGGDEWSIRQVEAGFNPDYDRMEHAFMTYTGFPTSELLYKNLMNVFQNV